MRIRLFPPYYSCRYSTSPVADWLDDFAQWLKVTGYTRTPMRGHISILRWALERRAPVPPDTHFSHADLRQLFGSSKKPRLFRATRRVFERFLRSRGQWIEQPSTDRHAALLDAYRAYLLKMRGLSAMSVYHHTATAAAFLKQAAPTSHRVAALAAAQRPARHRLRIGQPDRTIAYGCQLTLQHHGRRLPGRVREKDAASPVWVIVRVELLAGQRTSRLCRADRGSVSGRTSCRN